MDESEKLDIKTESLLSKSRKKPPLTAATIAKHFNVNRSTVSGWIHKGCPTTTLKAVAEWRAAHLRSERQPVDQRGGEGGPGRLTLNDRRVKADTRKILSDVALRELRLAEKRGDLVSRKEANRELAEYFVRVKERLLAAPDEFETRFPAEVRIQCKADFKEFIRQLLLELSRWQLLGKSAEDIILAAAAAIQLARAVENLEEAPAL